MECQYWRLYGQERECPNEAFANITIQGDRGSLTINVCEEYLAVLSSQFPTEESEEARSAR